jgi:glycogen operon protein
MNEQIPLRQGPFSPNDAASNIDTGRSRWEHTEGQASPLGATMCEDGNAINFAIYSKHATQVRLLLFTVGNLKTPELRVELDFRKNKSGPVWHCRLPLQDLNESQFYGYQIDGPSPSEGFLCHSFDSEKLLLDPHAKMIHFPPKFDRAAAIAPGSNVGRAPLAVLPNVRCSFEFKNENRPRHDHDLIIYEMHVKGFTANPNSGLAAVKRGTFAGMIEKIPYLVDLGITAIELMPIFQFDPQEDNYWGYMPLSFFAPHHEYSVDSERCDQLNEFRSMVHKFHDAGIEVILDVVFNHTCEQDASGPTYSLKGIDNSTYYMLDPNAENPFVNFSGTGNTLHTVNAATRQLILDSLRYWVQEMHVDGFRFDLASIFTRYPDGRINTEDPLIFSQIAADNELADVRLIAEPWDAVGTKQLGRKFPGHLWMQWNSDYRDTLQQFVRGDCGIVPDLMTRVYGSADHFPDERLFAFRPPQTINYVACHDGMTMYDLVTYHTKNNWANGHENKDGPAEFRWNCGWEGEEHVPAEVMKLRKRQIKNYFTLLMLSNGTPMFRMGDEFLQTQLGNSNPFNQDNETSWLDWSRYDRYSDIFQFFKMMISFRKKHPSISRSRFWRDDIHWYGADHQPDLSTPSKAIAWCLHGKSQNDSDLYVMVNANDYDLKFGIHEGAVGDWHRVIDTSLESPNAIIDEMHAETVVASSMNVAQRSIVVLIR